MSIVNLNLPDLSDLPSVLDVPNLPYSDLPDYLDPGPPIDFPVLPSKVFRNYIVEVLSTKLGNYWVI